MQVKPNGKVDLWDAEDGVMVELWAADAMHALSADPERYSIDKPVHPPTEQTDPIEQDEGKSS